MSRTFSAPRVNREEASLDGKTPSFSQTLSINGCILSNMLTLIGLTFKRVPLIQDISLRRSKGLSVIQELQSSSVSPVLEYSDSYSYSEYNSSTCKYSARTRLSVLEIYLDLARTRFFVLEFWVYSNVKYSVLGPSTREYHSSTALNRKGFCTGIHKTHC